MDSMFTGSVLIVSRIAHHNRYVKFYFSWMDVLGAVGKVRVVNRVPDFRFVPIDIGIRDRFGTKNQIEFRFETLSKVHFPSG